MLNKQVQGKKDHSNIKLDDFYTLFRAGLKSLIIDKRNHIGGNCYDYIDEHGIRVSLYGAHIFHTKHQRVWNYVNQFSEWIPYQHKVKGNVEMNGTYHIVPVPPNQDSVNILFGTNITTVPEVRQFYVNSNTNLS